MDVNVEETSAIAKTVTVTVEESVIEKAVAKKLQKMGKNAKIQGFRAGKAPMKLLRRKYGNAAHMDAVEDVVRKSMGDVLDTDDLKGTVHASRPELGAGLAPGGPITFKFTAERFPEFVPDGYTGLTVQQENAKVDAEAIQTQLESMRDEAATVVPVEDREIVEAGDIVIATYAGVGDDEVGEIHAEEQEIDLGDEGLLEGLAEGLLGKKVGDETDVEVQLPENFPLESIKGTKITLRITVDELKVREVPELNDEFAQDVSDFQTLDELRADMEVRAKEEAEEKTKSAALRRAIEAVVASNPVELPPLFIQARAYEEATERMRTLSAQGIDLSMLGQDISGFADTMKVRVSAGLHESLIVREIAKKEGIEASDADVDTFLTEQAEKTGQPLARLRAQVASPEALENLKSRLVYDKVVAFVYDAATIEMVDELPEEEEEEGAAAAPAHGEEGHVHGPDCDH
ncbi:MAG: trigger factor [Bradymonadia bacterium]|jgi:trigger factor